MLCQWFRNDHVEMDWSVSTNASHTHTGCDPLSKNWSVSDYSCNKQPPGQFRNACCDPCLWKYSTINFHIIVSKLLPQVINQSFWSYILCKTIYPWVLFFEMYAFIWKTRVLTINHASSFCPFAIAVYLFVIFRNIDELVIPAESPVSKSTCSSWKDLWLSKSAWMVLTLQLFGLSRIQIIQIAETGATPIPAFEVEFVYNIYV